LRSLVPRNRLQAAPSSAEAGRDGRAARRGGHGEAVPAPVSHADGEGPAERVHRRGHLQREEEQVSREPGVVGLPRAGRGGRSVRGRACHPDGMAALGRQEQVRQPHHEGEVAGQGGGEPNASAKKPASSFLLALASESSARKPTSSFWQANRAQQKPTSCLALATPPPPTPPPTPPTPRPALS
jgi:hypothetical protein